MLDLESVLYLQRRHSGLCGHRSQGQLDDGRFTANTIGQLHHRRLGAALPSRFVRGATAPLRKQECSLAWKPCIRHRKLPLV